MSDTTTTLTGTRIRVDSFYNGNHTEHIGKFATITSGAPDSDGDVNCTLDGHPGSTWYAHTWTVLGAGDTLPGTESNPVGQVATPTELTSAEARLERLIDAIYDGARQNGYMSLIPELFADAGIPLREVKRTATLRGLRIVSLPTIAPVNDAMTALRQSDTPSEVTVTVNRTVADYSVTVPWVEINPDGERPNCSDLADRLTQGEFADVPNAVLIRAGMAIGLGSNPDSIRRALIKHGKAGSEYGLTLTCDHC